MPKTSADSGQRREAVNNALELAIERRDMDMIRLALTNGAAPKMLLDAGISAERMDMIGLALDNGADPNVLLFAAIERGVPKSETATYLLICLYNEHAEPRKTSLSWVKTAVAHGADCSATKNDGVGKPWAAIHWAHDKFNPDILDVLLAHGAKVDAPSPEGTPLMRAISGGSAKAAEYYLNNGADPTCLCGKSQKDFPMRALEKSENFGGGRKAKLLALMMKHLPAAAADVPPAAPAPATTTPAESIGTAQDIEVSKPLELKVPPKPEAPQKRFEL